MAICYRRGSMREWAVALLVVGCTPEAAPSDAVAVVAEKPVGAPASTPEALLALPPSSRAAMSSPPREQWACAFEVDENQGIVAHGRAVFRYGDRTSCMLPHSIVASGVYGCPQSFERTDTDGMVRQRAFEYDGQGRLVAFHGNVTMRYAWEGDRLVSVAREQFGEVDLATYRDDGDLIVAVDDKGQNQEVLRVENGRLLALEELLYGRTSGIATITWAGERPTSVRVDVRGPVHGRVERDFQYDCPPK
jgi:hypothetical protein